jgi:hypothetical protein
LLGPMSEAGFAVGAVPTGIVGPGGSTLFIRRDGANTQYSSDQIDWYDIPTFPCLVTNTDTSAGVLKIEFATDITLASDTAYFICGSSHIQFGSSSLRDDGSKATIAIDGVTGYPGFIQNGSEASDGYNNIHVYNLHVTTANGSTLASFGGWVCQQRFAQNATSNYIINCSSTGSIPLLGGGIVGIGAANTGGNLSVIGCSSTGQILQSAGGIIGGTACFQNGTILCDGCWSTGAISGNSAAGIVGGAFANSNTIGTILITNCYSAGVISGNESGGIFAPAFIAPNTSIVIRNCYTTGNILGSNSGGIIGRVDTFSFTIQNCYSTGSIFGRLGAGGICANIGNINDTVFPVYNCYVAGTIEEGYENGYIIGGRTVIPATCFSEAFSGPPGSWNSTNANTVLTGIPSPVIGTSWVSTGTNAPYELFAMGYTPYTLQMITATPSLLRQFSATVLPAGSTNPAVLSARNYTLLGNSYGTITIDSNTGVISTTSATVPGTYVLYIRNDGSYHITEYALYVVSASSELPCCLHPVDTIGADNQTQTEVKAGLAIIANFAERRGLLSHVDFLRMKRAYAFKR